HSGSGHPRDLHLNSRRQRLMFIRDRDLDRALEAALEIPGGTLARLRREALAERAAAMLDGDSGESAEPGEAYVPAEPGGTSPRGYRRPRALLPVAPGAGLGGAAPARGVARGGPAPPAPTAP
ncbi:hypothetical protein ACFWW0_22700, partial [Streptomyces violascens]